MGKTIIISKGQKVSFDKNASCAICTLQWNKAKMNGVYDLELDVSAFILYSDGKVKNDDDFIFYNNPRSKDGAIEMASEGSCKSEIRVDFTGVSSDVSKIVVTLTIYDANKRNQTFAQLESLVADIKSDATMLGSYNIDSSRFKVETAIVVCEIYRYKDTWKFAAIGAGYRNGLNALCDEYGIAIIDNELSGDVSTPKRDHKKKTDKKSYPPKLSDDELLQLTDSIFEALDAVDRIIKQNSDIARRAMNEDKEIFSSLVYVCVAYIKERIELERSTKTALVKRIYSKSRRFTGHEHLDEDDLDDCIESVFDNLDLIEVTIGSCGTTATSLYCVIINAVAQMFLRAAAQLSERDLNTYDKLIDILGDFDKTATLDALSKRVDVSGIKQLDEWYQKYVFTGALFETEELSLEELLEELDSLTGLREVKNDINSLINMVRIQELRKERNLPVSPMSLHLVFSGNPGTGKTTVARLIAKIYKAMGLLKKGHLIEVDRSKLVAGYVGQTAIKVSEAVESAIGGVLFIDEAYSLTVDKGGNDFGQEAVDTLLKAMEDRRGEFIVIVAGYNTQMQQFVLSNPGLQSRFNKYIYFEDYTPRELLSIFKGMCIKSGMVVARDAEKYVASFFNDRYNNRTKNYANARDVRNFYEKMLVSQANRLSDKKNLTDEELSYIRHEDVVSVLL